jgi:hypothetical protein
MSNPTTGSSTEGPSIRTYLDGWNLLLILLGITLVLVLRPW